MSRSVEVEPWETIIYAIVHDVGKVINRYARRVREGIEKLDEELKSTLLRYYNINVEVLAETSHDELSRLTFNKIAGKALSNYAVKIIREVLSKADPLAAAERGFETKYSNLLGKLIETNVLDRISKLLNINYDYHLTPLLSPLWIAYITGYREYVGPRAYKDNRVGGYNSGKALDILSKYLEETIKSIEEGDVEGLIRGNSKIIRDLLTENLWIPIKPLTRDNILQLECKNYRDAQLESSYYDVTFRLLRMIDDANAIFKGRMSKGLADTLLNILKNTTFFVPSAIFGTIVPDISLFSHTKLVTAYLASNVLGRIDKYRLLVIDVNGIQKFVASPVKAAAASRVIRGRSLLVELALDAIAHYALYLFNGLPEANIITSEGGTLTLIIPDVNVDSNLGLLREVVKEFSELLNYNLGFTIAYSRPFGIEDSYFLHSLKDRRGFVEVLKTLSDSVAVEKARREGGVTGVLMSSSDIEEFDSLTGEPVSTASLNSGLALRVSSDNAEYVEEIAGPEKLSIGDCVSEATHLSLVAGSLSRNLIGIIGIYAYDKEGRAPGEEFVEYLLGKLAGRIDGYYRLVSEDGIPELPQIRGKVGFVPFKPLGTLYILVSLIKNEPYDSEEDSKLAWSLIYIVLNKLLGILKKEHALEYEIEVRINLVNAPTTFIPSASNVGVLYRSTTSIIGRMLELGVDVGFASIFTSNYHPVEIRKDKEGRGRVMLIGLDEYALIGMAKADLDMVGEVRATLSFSPSRLVSFSELLNLVLAGKSHLYTVDFSKDLLKDNRTYDVIVLYAGGDDLTVYGRWNAVLHFIHAIYCSVSKALYPLTFSSSMIVERPTTPILLLYGSIVEDLESKAKKVRCSSTLSLESVREVRVDDGYVLVETMPFKCEPPWPEDCISAYNIELISTLLDPRVIVRVDSVFNRVKTFKQELQLLARIGYYVQELMRKYGGIEKAPAIDRVRLGIAYSYIWSRRRTRLNEISDLLGNLPLKCKPKILEFPEDTRKVGFVEALRVLAAAKPVLDFLLLGIRRSESLEPTMFRGEVEQVP